MLTIILNPKSGSAGEDFRERVEGALQEVGAEYEILETTLEVGGRELALQAIEKGARHLVACGGDGTVMSVVNGIGQSNLVDKDKEPSVRLSIVPGGTANLLAGALKIPSDVTEAIEIAQNGRDRPLDLGICGKTWFALGLGLGLTEKLVSQTSAEEKEQLGKLAYAKAMLREMGMRPHNFKLKLDDQRPGIHKGVAVVVANAGEIGGGFKFAPNAEIDDGVLDVCVLHRFYFRDVMRLGWRALFGTMPEDRAVSFFQAKRIEILSDPPLDLQIDGEEVDQQIPLVAEIVPHALYARVSQEEAEAIDEAKTPEGQEALKEEAAARNRWLMLGVVVIVASLAYGLWTLARKTKERIEAS